MTYDSIASFCRAHGLNDTAFPVDNDDSCHDIKEFMFYGYERFRVSGFNFIKGEIEVPKPIGHVYGYSIFKE